jgi:hypothetical protein
LFRLAGSDPKNKILADGLPPNATESGAIGIWIAVGKHPAQECRAFGRAGPLQEDAAAYGDFERDGQDKLGLELSANRLTAYRRIGLRKDGAVNLAVPQDKVGRISIGREGASRPEQERYGNYL